MPIELSPGDVQSLLNLGNNLAEIEQELQRAEKAGINVTRLRQSFNTVVTQHAGLIQHYVQPQTQQAQRKIR